VKFAWIAVEKALYPVAVACRVLEVSRSGFYAWERRSPAARHAEDARLRVEVAAAHHGSRGAYGSPRVHRDLREAGRRVGRKRVARLMREQQLAGKCRRRFRTTTNSQHAHPIAENVVKRNFTVDRPNAVWVGDITYIWTLEGWLYLAVLIDLYSRMVVGWSVQDRMDRGIAIEALRMARTRRRPQRGLVQHTDRGSQYASSDYRTALAQGGMVCSMSRKGNCWDNAVAESFFASLKREALDGPAPETRAAARTAIGEYIERFYNSRRRHSHLDYVSPIKYEESFRRTAQAA
jgi:putative transposase